MFNVTRYPHGTFSWADLVSMDQPTARNFYEKLMNWDTQDVPMGEGATYTLFLVDGRRAAAVGPMPQAMQAQGLPSAWNNYITVDDVDALVEKVTEAGGTVVAPPFDVFDNGRMMTIQDPSGAHVCLWQPKNAIGAGIVNTVGAMGWNELITHDPKAAQDFFGKLFGWTFEQQEDSGYITFKNNGRYNGGIFKMGEEMKDIPPHWMTYFTVADIKATVAKAKELGGVVHTDIMSAANAGEFAVIADPTGATFTAMQAYSVDEWTEAEG